MKQEFIKNTKHTLEVVGAAIINLNNEVLCAQRGYGSLAGKWEFPGGKIESGETDQQALIREIKEELDIEINVCDFIKEVYNEYQNFNVILRVYRCEYISGVINDTEHKSLKWMKISDIEELDWAEADKPIVATLLNK